MDDLKPAQRTQLEEARRFLQLLSQPEREVVELAVQGHSDQIIAARCYISQHTVRRHIENMQGKVEAVYGRKLKFRQQLVPKVTPYLFLFAM